MRADDRQRAVGRRSQPSRARAAVARHAASTTRLCATAATVGVVLAPTTLAIARALDDAGVDRIEAARPRVGRRRGGDPADRRAACARDWVCAGGQGMSSTRRAGVRAAVIEADLGREDSAIGGLARRMLGRIQQGGLVCGRGGDHVQRSSGRRLARGVEFFSKATSAVEGEAEVVVSTRRIATPEVRVPRGQAVD